MPGDEATTDAGVESAPAPGRWRALAARLARRDWVFAALFSSLLVAYCLPVALVKYPPLQDLGAHLRIIHLWSVLEGPPSAERAAVAEHYKLRVDGKVTPYLTYYGGVRALARVMPLWVASHVLLLAYVIGLPLSFLYLLGAFGRDKRLALFSFPLIYNPVLIYGFIPNALSLPLFVLCLGVLKRYLDGPVWWRAVGLAALVVMLFLSHVAGFFAFVIAGPVVFFCQVHRPLLILRRAAFAVPAIAVALFWSKATVSDGDDFNADWEPLHKVGGIFVSWLNDVLRSDHDERLLIVGVLTLGLAVVVSSRRLSLARPLADRGLGLAALALLVAFFVLPFGVSEPVYHWGTQARVVIPAALLIIAASRVDLSGWRAVILIPFWLMSLWCAEALTTSFRAYDVQARDLEVAFDAVPRNRRVLPLLDDRYDGMHRGAAMLHLPDLFEVRRGGYIGSGFIADEVIPVETTTTHPAPDFTLPGDFTYDAHGRYYHFYLRILPLGVRAQGTFTGGDEKHVELVRQAGRFAIYRNIGKSQPPVVGAK